MCNAPRVILSEARTRSVRAKSKDLMKWVAQCGKAATLRLSQSCKFFHSNKTITPSMRSFDSVFLRGLRKTPLRMTNGCNSAYKTPAKCGCEGGEARTHFPLFSKTINLRGAFRKTWLPCILKTPARCANALPIAREGVC